ncbi:MAG TPA: SRPBCC family protein [Nocardioides sp.]|jgi:hypothetical protein|nr:SRPBCC family protein [Nocardioides sp.]
MATTGTAVTGPRSPAEVWERYARPAVWSSWAPQIRDVEVDVDRLEAGVTGRVLGWGGLSADFVVDTWDEDHLRWGWTVRPHVALPPGVPHSGRLPEVRLRHGVRSAGSGSRAWLVVHGPALLVAGYFLPARLALHRLTH